MTSNRRKAISKRARFEIFKRDGFVCQYCGSSPPAVVLEVDHITPVASGGDNSDDNLITACFDCNRGKSHIELSVSPETVEIKAEKLKEREAQLRAYKKLISAVKQRNTREVKTIEGVFSTYYPGSAFTDKFANDIKTCFLPKLTVDVLEQNMHRACGLIGSDADRAIRYFCGTNWRMIKGDHKYG